MRFSASERFSLRQWLSNMLVMLCDDADPTALSDLAIACLAKEAPESELRSDILAELSHFLKDETVPFVGKLFDALTSKSYMVQTETVDTEGVAVVQEKRANSRSRSPERRSGSRERARGYESSRRRSRSRERPDVSGSNISGSEKNAPRNDRGKPVRDAVRGDRRVDDRRGNADFDAWRSGGRPPGGGANIYPRPNAGGDHYSGPYQWLGNGGGYAGRQPAQFMPGGSQTPYGYPYGAPSGHSPSYSYSQPPGSMPFAPPPRGMPAFPAPPAFPALSPPGHHLKPTWPPAQPVGPPAATALSLPAPPDAAGASLGVKASPQMASAGFAAAVPTASPRTSASSAHPHPTANALQQQDVPLSQKRTLRVSDIPMSLLNMANLAEHFGRFGVVSNLLVRPPVRGDSKSEAYVQFSDHQAATRAKTSSEPVCGNASISLSWARFDPLSPEGTPVDVLVNSDQREWGDRRSGPSPSPASSMDPGYGPGHGFRSAPLVSSLPVQSLLPASPMVAAQQLLEKQREQAVLVDSAIAKYKGMLLGLQGSRANLDKSQLAAALADIKAQAEAIKAAQSRLSAAIATAQRAAQAAQDAVEKKAQASLTRQGNVLVVTASETTAALRIAPFSIGGVATALLAAEDAAKIETDESDAVLVTGEDELTTTEADSASFADQAASGGNEEMYRGGGIEERGDY